MLGVQGRVREREREGESVYVSVCQRERARERERDRERGSPWRLPEHHQRERLGEVILQQVEDLFQGIVVQILLHRQPLQVDDARELVHGPFLGQEGGDDLVQRKNDVPARRRAREE